MTGGVCTLPILAKQIRSNFLNLQAFKTAFDVLTQFSAIRELSYDSVSN